MAPPNFIKKQAVTLFKIEVRKTKKEAKYKPDQTIIKLYGYGDNKKIKVITMAYLRTSGLDIDMGINVNYSNRGTVNAEKLDVNIVRAKNKIFELAYCNPWDYFFTATLNPNLYDRTNLEKFHKDLTKFISHQGEKYNSKISFLFIPELHADGKSWHMHGFIYGLPLAALHKFQLGDIMSGNQVYKVKKGQILYNWLDYANKFGFCDLEPIRNSEAVSKYITKYINKNLFTSVTQLNAHLYYHSRGLRFADVIKKGSMSGLDIEPNFSNDYCQVSWFDYSPEKLAELTNSIIKTLT